MESVKTDATVPDQISSTEDMIAQDFLAKNQDLIQEKTSTLEQIDSNINSSLSKVEEQQQAIQRIDDEQAKILAKINQLRGNV